MRRAVLQRRTSRVWEVSCGIQGDRHLQQVSAAHRLGTRFRLRLLQDSRQGGLPLLPPQVSNRRLLGRFLEGETGNGTTLRVCAGWRLDLLLKRRDMEKLKAKQTVSNLTEAEAIEQATVPAGRSASASTILGNCRLRDFLFRENSVTPVGDFTARAR